MSITVYVGGYGSGKTQLALNKASELAAAGRPTVLVDLDIVNPYFRSMDHRRQMEAKGIRCLGPTFANTTVDIPALPAEILSVFDSGEDVVMDVGGDPVGATALGGYAHKLKDATVYMVVNTCRPLTGTAADIEEMAADIQRCSRMQIRGFINNSNLGPETEVQQLLEGGAILRLVSRDTGIPVLGVAGRRDILAQLPAWVKEPRMPIDIYTRMLWQDGE